MEEPEAHLALEEGDGGGVSVDDVPSVEPTLERGARKVEGGGKTPLTEAKPLDRRVEGVEELGLAEPGVRRHFVVTGYDDLAV